MVKIRLKRMGYKRNPIYRVVVINSTSKREGRPIEELGFYNPKTKEMKLKKEIALEWIQKGAQTSDTVKYLIDNANDDGSLNYKPKESTKLSKKALAKVQEEKANAEKAKTEAAAKAKSDAEAAEKAKEEAAAAEAAPVAEVVETEATVEATEETTV